MDTFQSIYEHLSRKWRDIESKLETLAEEADKMELLSLEDMPEGDRLTALVKLNRVHQKNLRDIQTQYLRMKVEIKQLYSDVNADYHQYTPDELGRVTALMGAQFTKEDGATRMASP